MKIRSIKQLAVVGVLAAGLAACADSPTGVTSPKVDGPSFVLNTTPIINTYANTPFFEEKVVVCKDFTGSALAYPSASFSAVFTGTYNATVNFSLNDGQCADLGDFGGAGVDVTVTETAIPNYTTSWTSQTASYIGGATVLGAVSAPTASLVATGSAFGTRAGLEDQGVRFVFTNTYVPPQGCTYTIGYWKTHSENGPAPYDDTWAQLANGASTTFYLSGTSWYNVFWTPPAGNPYYQLAHQFMGAVLNQINGASVPSNVATAIASATTLFNTYTPAQVAALPNNSSVKAQFKTLAGILGSYNEGAIGPGHCGE